MAQHYSIKDFFRQMPSALLARYSNTMGLFSDLNYAAMKEDKSDELFAGWLDLPDKQRNAMDAEFREIFEMICEKGFRAVIDEAELQLADEEFTAFVEKLSALPSHAERAMINFDSWIDSLKCHKNNKAHYIMGLCAVIGGKGGIRTHVTLQ